MKTFIGFTDKEKRFNKIYGSIFGLFLFIGICGAVKTPNYDELSLVIGTLESFECIVRKNSKGDSQWIEVTILSQGKPVSFTYQERCKNKSYTYKKGMNSEASSGRFGFSERLYELKIENKFALEYQDVVRKNYSLPFGLIFVFGLPWSIWALITIAKS